MKRTLFKKNANMSYVVHIVKMNNFNLQPPPLWPAYRRPSLLSPPVFFFFEGRVILYTDYPPPTPSETIAWQPCKSNSSLTSRKSFQNGGRAGVTDKQFGRKKNTVDFNRIPLLI